MSSSSSSIKNDISAKIKELDDILGRTGTKLATEERCIPFKLIIAVVFPIIIYAGLYITKLKFLMAADSTPSHPVRNLKRIFLITIVLTSLLWAYLIYDYNFKSGREICVV